MSRKHLRMFTSYCRRAVHDFCFMDIFYTWKIRCPTYYIFKIPVIASISCVSYSLIILHTVFIDFYVY